MKCCQFQKVRSALRMVSERAPNTLASQRSELIRCAFRYGLTFATCSELLTACREHSEGAPNVMRAS